MSVSLFDRRRWLQSTAVGGAAAVLAATDLGWMPAAHAQADGSPQQPSGTPLQLGLVTYNWGKDWDLPTLIENCSATGFRGVELRTTHKHGVELSLSASERADVKKRFADSNVRLVGLGSVCEYHATDPAVLQKHIEETKAFVRLCHDVGGGGVKVRPNGLPADVAVEQTIEQIGKSLREVAEYGSGYGVQIRLEVHGRGTSDLPVIEQIMRIADHPNNVICWNCNAQDLAGEGFEHNYDLVQPYMGLVHIHDLRISNYPWPALFERLKRCDAAGFTGWTLIEEGAVPDDLLVAMHENRQIWEELAA